MTEWYADESFWESLFPFVFPPERIEAGAGEVVQVLKLAGPPAHAVLDLCCGPGRHSVPFARHGCRVTAVDRSRFLLDEARTLAAEHAVEIEWVEADMRGFVRPEGFDLAVSMFTSWGYFETAEENLAVIANVHESLRPGGRLVIETIGKEQIARMFEATGSEEVEGAGMLIQRRRVCDDWSRMENDWILLSGTTVKVFHPNHWIYSGVELRDLLLSCGFERVDLYGGLDGSEYGLSAKRLVAVAKKGRTP
jgi:2-polyprenyl-3-methyl-5-hydroxy-6-metoxy-1,4-benzoquinol methylase